MFQPFMTGLSYQPYQLTPLSFQQRDYAQELTGIIQRNSRGNVDIMTYLNLVNNVLRRLREDEVTNVSESTYSKMVGDFVNDAKELVETAWDWSALRSTLTITTAADDYTYSLTGSGNEGKVFKLSTILLI